ncbi:hypothetical protein ACFQ0B_80700 [Nonomuraea thailandensis]
MNSRSGLITSATSRQSSPERRPSSRGFSPCSLIQAITGSTQRKPRSFAGLTCHRSCQVVPGKVSSQLRIQRAP